MASNTSTRRPIVVPQLAARLIPLALAAVAGLSSAASAGCSPGSALPVIDAGGGGTGDFSFARDGGTDMPASPDLVPAAPTDLATQPPDMAVPRDLIYTPTLMLEELATTITVNGNPTPARALATFVVNPDPELQQRSDYDDTVPPGLGCAANHYDLAKGDSPTPEIDLGAVTLSGYTAAAPFGSMVRVDSEINCALVAGVWRCSYGPLVNGMPGPQDINATYFPAMQPLIPAASVVRFRYAGGARLGAYDSMNVLKATDGLTLMEDLTRIVYDPAKDTVLHYTCDAKPMNCFDAVLVQVIASSVMAGQPGYPGSDFGTINCASLGGGQVFVKKEAIAAMLGNSPAIKQVMTRVLRGSLPPVGQRDSKGNPVRLFLGRGVMGFAPR